MAANKKLMADIGIDSVLSDTPINRFEESKSEKLTPTKKSSPTPTNSLAPLDQITSLEDLKQALSTFDKCSLKNTAINMVFSDGNPAADVMLIGEAPGADEDRQGKPFVGQSGQLLRRILSFIGLTIDHVYITNVLPYRPPGNRQPTPQEIDMFLPFLQKHIALIKPKCLLLIGGTACKALLNGRDGITKIRGQWIDLKVPGLSDPLKTMATYHPAYLLRSPLRKKDVWKDMREVKRFLSTTS
jgi:uracil-DNA glycosylase family 4